MSEKVQCGPRQIAQPLIAHKATFKQHKIIGVLYDETAWGAPLQSEMEVCECSGEHLLASLAAIALGLVEVVGQSAEPCALNGQYLIVKKEVTTEEALKTLDGKSIIASNTNDIYYFKRLRIVASDQIVQVNELAKT